MDALDTALLQAWQQLSERVKHDRLEAFRRGLRRTQGNLSKPIRPWCLCIRACDSRINRWTAQLDKDLPRLGLEHDVRIGAPSIRKLCAPVKIDWPGVPMRVAAARLGKGYGSITKWLKAGVFEVRYQPAATCSRRGKPVPVVWSSTPLDPNMDNGHAPDPEQGCLWQGLAAKVEDSVVLEARRVPRKDGLHRGWRWACPCCQRAVNCLYLPRREWTLADALGVDPLDVSLKLESPTQGPKPVSGQEPVPDANQATSPAESRFACHTCHQIMGFSMASAKGWGIFVGRISAGLLYGFEVPRPKEGRAVSKRPPGLRREAAARRARVVKLLRLGRTITQIAAELRVSRRCVDRHLAALRRSHNVVGTPALIARLRANPVLAQVGGSTETGSETQARKPCESLTPSVA